jgi:hypothetical protein
VNIPNAFPGSAPLFSRLELVFQNNLKSSWRGRGLDADGVHVLVLSGSIECPGYVARNRPLDLSVRESGIPVTRSYILPSTLLLRRALRHSPSFESFAERVLCLGMLSDFALQSFAGLA